MASLITYGTQVAATSLTSAGKLATSTGGTGGTTTTAIGTALGFGELCALGSASAWAAIPSTTPIASIAPTGKGWLLDSTLLNSQTFLAGNWTPTFKSKISAGTLTADVYIRAFAYDTSALTYTAIGTCVLTAQGWSTTAANYNFLATAIAEFTFNATQRLYIDCWPNVTANSSSAGSTFTVNLATTGASGVVGDMQMTTPNYVSLGTWNMTDNNLVASDSFLALETTFSTDALTTSDSFVALETVFSTDALIVSDSFFALQDAISTDSLSASDSFFVLQNSLSSDNLTVSDSFLASLQVFSVDSVPVSDTFIASSLALSSDGLSISDSFVALEVALSSDGLTASDSNSYLLSLGMLASSDNLAVSDSWLLMAVSEQVESLTVSDSFQALVLALSTDGLMAGDGCMWLTITPFAPPFWTATWKTWDGKVTWQTWNGNTSWETWDGNAAWVAP